IVTSGVPAKNYLNHADNGPPVEFTTVNIFSEPPRYHIIWSLFCFVHANPFSLDWLDKKVVGDLDGARHYGATAHFLNVAATVLGCIIILIMIIIVAKMSVVARMLHSS
uniref:Uncharacterized protein n=1 Tax=Echeneis naucrates TaxID=173247 RepID=A0A665UGB5_ECHNA